MHVIQYEHRIIWERERENTSLIYFIYFYF